MWATRRLLTAARLVFQQLHAARRTQSPLSSGHQPRWDRPETRRDPRSPAARLGGGRAASRRPSVSFARRDHRPAAPARDRARSGRRDRHLEGAHRPAPAGAASQCAHPLPGVRTRRHRRDRLHVFPCQSRVAAEAVAGGRDALRQRPHGVVQRPAEHGASRPYRDGGRVRRHAAGRAGLPDDGGLAAQGLAEGDRVGARNSSGAAGMD